MSVEDWKRRQEESVARYSSEHYNADPRRARMFGNFIATTLTDRNARVVDIGCGISPKLPYYVDELGLTDYLGIDPLEGPPREYPFQAASAEALPLNDCSVDAVIFATSFDHIANADKAMEEVKRVLRPGGAVYMWQGISDPDTIPINSTLHRLTRGPHMIPAVTAQAVKMSFLMWKRRRDLAQGNRLDAAHERWFTRQSLLDAFGTWGLEVTRSLEPFGMPVMFVEAIARQPSLAHPPSRDTEQDGYSPAATSA